MFHTIEKDARNPSCFTLKAWRLTTIPSRFLFSNSLIGCLHHYRFFLALCRRAVPLKFILGTFRAESQTQSIRNKVVDEAVLTRSVYIRASLLTVNRINVCLVDEVLTILGRLLLVSAYGHEFINVTSAIIIKFA